MTEITGDNAKRLLALKKRITDRLRRKHMMEPISADDLIYLARTRVDTSFNVGYADIGEPSNGALLVRMADALERVSVLLETADALFAEIEVQNGSVTCDSLREALNGVEGESDV